MRTAQDNPLKNAPHPAHVVDFRRVAARLRPRGSGVPGAVAARAQVLAAGGPRRQRLRRPQPGLHLPAAGRVRALKEEAPADRGRARRCGRTASGAFTPRLAQLAFAVLHQRCARIAADQPPLVHARAGANDAALAAHVGVGQRSYPAWSSASAFSPRRSSEHRAQDARVVGVALHAAAPRARRAFVPRCSASPRARRRNWLAARHTRERISR